MKKKYIVLMISICLISIFYQPVIPALKNSAPVIVPYDDILNETTKHIDPDKPMIAITFDDGPTRKYTTTILDCLKENHAYATFFVLGNRVDMAPDLLSRMILEGHEIGNHTYSHKQLTTLQENAITNEINKTSDVIYEAVHSYPTLIRPPYGSYNETVLNHLGEMRLVKWTLDSEDWRSKNTKIIVDKVMKEVNDKDIILFHDLYETTAEAVCILIPQLIEEGYQLVSVSDLYSFE